MTPDDISKLDDSAIQSVAAAPAAPKAATHKLLDLQILRAVAASLVVVDHSFWALQSNGYAVIRFIESGVLAGYLGVTSFFLLSGFIMMRLADGTNDEPNAPYVFAWHRAIRIVPMYWIATVLWYLNIEAPKHTMSQPIGQMVLSLAFIPNFLAIARQMQPILGQGWTLNHEVVFYLIVSLALFLPRRFRVLAVEAAIVLIVLVGINHRTLINEGPANVFSFYTSSITLFFAGGVLIGYVETKRRNIGTWNFPFSPAYLLVIPAAYIFLTIGKTPMAFNRVMTSNAVWIVVVLCSLAANRKGTWLGRLMILLGDASYSTYLFHQWAIIWIIPIAARIYSWFHATLDSPGAFVAMAIVASNAFGLIIHLLVERPVTRALRNLTLPFFNSAKPMTPAAA